MSDFIKLTPIKGPPRFFNMGLVQITDYTKGAVGSTLLFSGEQGTCVKETPEEIMALLNGEDVPPGPLPGLLSFLGREETTEKVPRKRATPLRRKRLGAPTSDAEPELSSSSRSTGDATCKPSDPEDRVPDALPSETPPSEPG